jgi:hypothetical protein
MFAINHFSQQLKNPSVTRLLVVLLAFCTLTIAGCGSTKVYTADKTVLYNDDLFNMSGVQQISSRVEGTLPDGTVENMKGMDKKAVNALLDQSSPIMVSMVVQMDQSEMIYRRQKITKYSEYSSMKKKFDKAMSSINKFMASGSSTQLKLK